ncbi:co-chaperone GroES [Oceanivirga miroungae]|uniref:10 kDa chaperonin n=1 Tax=Oceanivirga miroungae TaxID=1130046 RepID=A0A6I8M847_9FUSO|nr:co-chaperone GroES [Oceanivirga miroungae]VWL85702.1 chaperonin Cpn10 [Oceanivirga miroungae]
MIKPLGKRVLLKKIEEVLKTKTGIILKDSTTESDIYKAKVVEVSDEVSNILLDDIVYFSKFKGENVKIDDIEYIIIEEKDVLGKDIK